MLDSGSNRYSQACAAAERDRSGAVPLALPSDGFPRPEAFSQLVHMKGVRVQRGHYPRASFNAALEMAALSGLEAYRPKRRTFTGMDHVPIALVPRGSNVVLAHIPAILSQATDAVLALGHRLYFEVQGALRGIDQEKEDDDDDEAGLVHPLRGGGSHGGGGGGSCSSSGSHRTLAPAAGLTRSRSGLIGGGFNTNTSNSSVSISGGKFAAWMPSENGGAAADGGGNAAPLVPNRRGSTGAASPCTASSSRSSFQSTLQSFSSIKSSASSSFRSLRSALSARYSSSSRALQYSSDEPEIETPTDPRVSDGDDDYVALLNGGCYSLDKLAVAISVFADGDEGVQAFQQELERRGAQQTAGSSSGGGGGGGGGGGEPPWRPAAARLPCR